MTQTPDKKPRAKFETGQPAARRAPVWAYRIGDVRGTAYERTGAYGLFLQFTFERVFPGGSSRALGVRDLECVRPLVTRALRFARTWRPDREAPRS